MNGTCRAIAVSGTDVYVGGSFTDVSGIDAADRIARWNTTNSTWNAMGSGLNNTCNAIAVSGSDVYVGGAFTTANGVTHNRIARWTGSDWGDALGSGLNNTCRAIAVSGTDVYVGGDFTDVSGIAAADYIARWNTTNSTWNTASAQVTERVGATTISGNLTVDTNTLFVDAASNRVGIGMNNPSTAFHIASGNFMIASPARAILQHTTTGSNDGGSSVNGLNTRILNTIHSNTLGSDLTHNTSTGIFTLTAGTYYINAYATSATNTASGIRVIAVISQTDGTILLYGNPMYMNISNLSISVICNVSGIITLATTTNLVLRQHVAVGATATFGLGAASQVAGYTNVFAQVEIIRIA